MKARIEEGTEFHRSGLIGFSQMTSNRADSYWGLSDWVDAVSGFSLLWFFI